MELSSFDQSRRATLTKQMAIVVFSIVFFYAVICTPIYLWINSDILFAESWLPLIWDEVIELANYAFYWVSFAFLLYSFFRFETRDCKPFFIILSVAVLCRYPLYLLVGYFVNGFPLLDDFLIELPYLLLNTLFDAIIFAVFILAMMMVKRRASDRKYSKKGSFFSDHLPFARVFSIKNPIQSVLFVGAGALALWKIGSRIAYDVFLGPPQNLLDLFWMMLYYTLDVLFLFVSVLICVLLVNHLWFSEERARIELEDTEKTDRILP